MSDIGDSGFEATILTNTRVFKPHNSCFGGKKWRDNQQCETKCWWIIHHFDAWFVPIHNIWYFPSKNLVLNYQYCSYWFWKIQPHEHVELDKKSPIIMTSRFPKNFVCTHLIDLNQRSMNFNILLPIKEISSNTFNCNCSYIFIKLSNHFEFKDGKSLQLQKIERLEWIVVPSMLNIAFPMYALSNVFFHMDLIEDFCCKIIIDLESKAWVKTHQAPQKLYHNYNLSIIKIFGNTWTSHIGFFYLF